MLHRIYCIEIPFVAIRPRLFVIECLNYDVIQLLQVTFDVAPNLFIQQFYMY